MKKVLSSAVCAVLGLGSALSLAQPAAAAQQARVLKMQSTWPASLTLHEQFVYWPSALRSCPAAR